VSLQPALVILIATALVFDFFNGFNDSANIVATAISSRAMAPRTALMLTGIAEFSGPFLFGVAVAGTIGKDLVSTNQMTLGVLVAALAGAITWNAVTWYFGIPSSSSHALIGGIVGAVIVSHGASTLQPAGLSKVLIALFASPLVGLVTGYLGMKLILFVAQGASPRINIAFRHSQILTTVVLALSHGTNDAQKTMGIITLGLVSSGYLPGFAVPRWVIALSAGALALGMATGGWRIIRTLGGRIYRIRPVHGFASQTTAASVILGAALLGGPVSTTQVVSSAIVGVGSAEWWRRVRWGVAQDIVTAWLVTIPMSALIAAGVYTLVRGPLP
jgi:PiT family inorganic phosphate transporter